MSLRVVVSQLEALSLAFHFQMDEDRTGPQQLWLPALDQASQHSNMDREEVL